MTSNAASPDGRTRDESVSFRWELMRKGVHICSLSIPVLYFHITRDLALMILVPMTAAFIAGDLLRLFHRPSFDLYTRIFGRMLRTHEKTETKKTFNGATWVFIAALVTVFLFPKVIAITAFSILIISDTMAALIGRRYGTRTFRGKTIEGSSAFVVSATIVLLFTPKVAYLPGEYIAGIVASIIGAAAEVFSFNLIDDNFAIPISIGFALWLMYIVFLPQLNVFILDV